MTEGAKFSPEPSGGDVCADEFSGPARSSTESQKSALVIAGVGRSGTSALTRVLNLLGAMVPGNLIEEGPGNERGFWEPRRIVELSDEILQCFGSDWYDSRPMPLGWFETVRERGYIDRAAEVIQSEYGGAALIAIKDPRLCRLAPVYLEALRRLNYRPRIVIPVREPSEMVASIRRREGMDARAAELIWIRHMLEIEAATRSCQRVWTAYDALLEDWRTVIGRITATFALDWPNDIDDVADDINAFLTPSLRHFDGRRVQNDRAGPLASKLWECLKRDQPDSEQHVRGQFDAVRVFVNDLDRLNGSNADLDRGHAESLRRAITDLDDAIRALQASAVVEMERKLGALTDQAEAIQRTAHMAWLSARRILSDGAAASKTEEVGAPRVPEMHEVIARALEKLQSDVAMLVSERDAVQHRLDIVQGSRSWALTRPLRDLNALAGNLGKRRKV